MNENTEKTLDDRLEKAFDYATDATKQMLTLSTAIISATVLLSRDYVRTLPFFAKTSLVFSWLGYLFSAFFGIWTLLAITGTLVPSNQRNSCGSSNGSENSILSPPQIWASNIRIPLFLQIFSFLLATGLIVVFGIQLITEPLTSSPSISTPSPTPSPSLPSPSISTPSPTPSPSLPSPSISTPSPTPSP